MASRENNENKNARILNILANANPGNDPTTIHANEPAPIELDDVKGEFDGDNGLGSQYHDSGDESDFDIDDHVKQYHQSRLEMEQKEEKLEQKRKFCTCIKWKHLKKMIDLGLILVMLIIIIIAEAEQERWDDETPTAQCELRSCSLSAGQYPKLIFNDYNNATETVTCAAGSCEDIYSDSRGAFEYKSLRLGMKFCLALIPFLCVFQGVLSFNLSSRYVAPFTLLVTVILALSFFRDADWTKDDDIFMAGGKAFLLICDRAIWTIFEYALSVFTAFFFLRILQIWGIVETMREEFDLIADTIYRKITLVAFCFAIMIAVVAPGGSNFLIAGAILIDMNLLNLRQGSEEWRAANKRIGAICLFGNGLTSAFNLLGVCIIALSADIADLARDAGEECGSEADQAECGEKEIGYWFSAQFFIFCIISPVLMGMIYSPEDGYLNKLRAMKPDLIIMCVTGLVYAIVQLLVAWQLGPQLPCLLAAGIALVVYVLIEKLGEGSCGFPQSWSRFKFTLPFVLLITVLLILEMVEPLTEFLQGSFDEEKAAEIMNPRIYKIYGDDTDLERRFDWLTDAAVWVGVISVVTPFIVPYRQSPPSSEQGAHHVLSAVISQEGVHVQGRERFKEAIRKTIVRTKVVRAMKTTTNSLRFNALKLAFSDAVDEALPVMLSIGAYASIAKVMSKFEMTQSIALALVDVLKDAPAIWVCFMPIIGMLGSGLTGSTTTSNFLFGQLQVATALDLGIAGPGAASVYSVAGIQVLGATAGEILSPMNAVFSTILRGVGPPESDIMRIVIPYAMWWLLGCIVMSFIFMLPYM